jgi:two-component system cell cycle sensor histidine kinase/response regulator CckA
MFAASDTGTGMDAETQARLFEPFFTTKEKGTGTGLGLATVYGIVTQSGGHIRVYSAPGQGTSMKVYLPRVAAPIEPISSPAQASGSLRGSETILIVEDQEEVRKLTSRILEARGYRVLAASSGVDALRLSQELEALRVADPAAGRIDLLLTDVIMPGMGGREVALLLGPAHANMKVLFVSGYTDESIVHQGVLEPSIAFLQKPFTVEALAQKVREVLDSPGDG